VAIITGGARGIGASVSRLFAREGASLVINDLGGAPDGSGGDEGPAKQIADEVLFLHQGHVMAQGHPQARLQACARTHGIVRATPGNSRK